MKRTIREIDRGEFFAQLWTKSGQGNPVIVVGKLFRDQLYRASFDYLLDYLRSNGMSNSQIARVFGVADGRVSDWFNLKRVAEGDVFLQGLTYVENTFSNFHPLSARERHLRGLLALLPAVRRRWFPDDRGGEDLNEKWLGLMLYLYDQGFTRREKLDAPEYDRTDGALFFEHVRRFAFASRHSDSRISATLCSWLRPFECVRVCDGELFDRKVVAYPSLSRDGSRGSLPL